MQGYEWRGWQAGVERLTLQQREQLRDRLQAVEATDALTQLLDSRVTQVLTCPACGGTHCVRNGHADGLQRYKCRGCARSFNALSGTPLARLRLRAKWSDQAVVLHQGLSVRTAAQQLGVHRTTAFRWRHRFLRVPSQLKAAQLVGVAEADETYVLRSYKGQRRQLLQEQTRAARKRGGRAIKRGLSDEQIPILVLRNRSGQTTDFVLPAPATKRDVKALLPLALAGDAVLCTDASGLLAAAAHDLGLEHHAVNSAQGERVRGAWHIQNVNAYHSRLKAWLRRFKGVATSYLPNYLGWFRALDRNAQSGAKPLSLLAIAIGA